MFSKTEENIKDNVNTKLKCIDPKLHIIFLDYKKLKNGIKIEELFNNPKPIIFISNYNIFDEKTIPSEYVINGRKLFFDSSIWFHFLILGDNLNDSITSIKNRIIQNKNLYKLNVAKEYYNFILRLYKNSYLQVGGHSSFVTPFKFHSEIKMKSMADEYLTGENGKPNLTEFKWRLLLVDDYADKPLQVNEKLKDKILVDIKKVLGIDNKSCEVLVSRLFDFPKSKLKNWKDLDKEEKEKIVKKSLSSQKEIKIFLNLYSDKLTSIVEKLPPSKSEILKNDLSDYNWIEVETCSSVSEIVDKYSNGDKIYDIILLDYLLGDVSVGNNQRRGREYSTDILEWIKKDKKFAEYTNDKFITELKGPLGKFWFFPISVFSFAFMEDIRQMGYTYYDDDWVIARGADPVNTPELFRYSLFKFMEAQLNEANRYSKNKSKNKNLREISLKTFISNIFSENKDYKTIKKIVEQKYEDFIDFRHTYEVLSTDKKNGSNFAKSILQDNFDPDKIFWEHLHHLIYMLAFEPSSEWPRMWDEFNIIKNILNKSDNNETSGIDFLNPIRNFIISLQKETRGK